VLLVYFVWLAAQRRKNCHAGVLAAALVLSVISAGAGDIGNGIQFE